MSIIDKDDEQTIIKAAGMQGVANGQRSAIARGLLAVHTHLNGGGGTALRSDGNTLEIRLGELESAIAGLPGAEPLEQALGDIGARLARIEGELGLGASEPGAPDDEPEKPKRRGKTG